ncbi:MAG: aldo/keto reductase [Pleurocapsa sp.]
MKYKQFGNTDLEVSVMGLGCSRLGGNLSVGNKQEAVKMLNLAIDSGINFYDTADSYGQGQSETLLGKTFKHQRDKVIFASKAGYTLSPLGSIAAKFKPVLKPLVRSLRALKSSSNSDSLGDAKASVLRQNFERNYLTTAVEGSLKRLQTDYLDLFQLHSPSSEILQSSEVWQTLESLKKQGKIRYYGVSCDTVEDALICLQQPGLASIQLEINWLQSEAIAKVLPLAQQQGVAVVARQPFASGKLFAAEYNVFSSLHSKYHSITHVALQFVLQQTGVSVVIPGASSCQHLKNNLEVLDASLLSQNELQAITQSANPSKII